MYCTAPLSPRKGRLISFHDDDDDDDASWALRVKQKTTGGMDGFKYVIAAFSIYLFIYLFIGY